MKILTIGKQSSIDEFKNKFENAGNSTLKDSKSQDFSDEFFENTFTYITGYEDINEHILAEQNIIFDFFLEDSIENFDFYKDYSKLIIFGNIPKTSLVEFKYYYGRFSPRLYGFNGMAGMLNRPYLEITASSVQDKNELPGIFNKLGSEYLLVDDRVGMVTPRIISMIINEAYFTVQEGTATKEDIDIAMKLGTNYPWGPFEWCQKYGVKNIYELLEALYEDTKDERYKICPLLKREYMMEN